MRKSKHNINKALAIHHYVGIESDNITHNFLSNNTLKKYI